jgi:hypothetical protein
VVRLVNSRAFSYSLAERCGWKVPGSRLCSTADQIREFCRAQHSGRYVFKPLFGNAGLGFIHVQSGGVSPKQQRTLTAELCACGSIVAEPWYHRTADISCSFTLGSNGSVDEQRMYKTLTTPHGAFYGCEPLQMDPDLLERYRSAMQPVINTVAATLYSRGYFGPVSIDSMYIQTTSSTPHLVPLLEINARYSMSRIGFCVDRALGGAHHCFRFRTLGRARHWLDPTYTAWQSRIGSLGYNGQRGVALLTPLRLQNGTTRSQPLRSLFYICGASTGEVAAIDTEFSALLQRTAS